VLAEYEGAVAEYQQALACIRQAGNRRQETEILLGLSSVYNWYHKTEPALQCVNAALAVALEIGDRPSQASCLVMRGEALAAGYGRVMEATPDLEEAVRLSKEIADPRLLARTLIFAGRNLQWRSEFERTIAYLQEGVELARREHSGFLLGLGLFSLGHAYLAKGEYEEALRSYYALREYAGAAGDKWWITRTPNCIGGVHLELYDVEEAVRLNEENDDLAKRLWPWPEPRGHSLVKLGLAHLYGDDHARAQEAFEQAWGLLEADPWGRWRWHMPLLCARGELALAEGRHEEAWTYATQSLEMATQTDSPKHVARAQRLQGDILAASGRLDDAVRALEGSVKLAERLQTPREVWLGKAALGRVLARLGREKAAEVHFIQAAHTIEAIADKLQLPSLRRSFLAAEPVVDLYRTLGQRPPPAMP
ncbi:MAG: tetratricopeptide repeat protein, partial [Candidatus Entotheonellia bacterium]